MEKQYNMYKDLLYQNYGRNRYVEKKGKKYLFEFRGEEVSIRLGHSQIGMHTQSEYRDGHRLRCEVIGILGKQYKRLKSGELQIPGTEIDISDENNCKEQLVSKDEFRECFANPYAYGRDNSKWPRNTILLYKYSSNATTKYWDIPEDTWKRINNEKGKHAEKKMIKDLKNIQEYLTIQPDDNEGSNKAILSVEVISSYSPCEECSLELCKLKKKMDEKVKQSNQKVEQSQKRVKSSDIFREDFSALSLTTEIKEVEQIKFKITFSNFYRHLEKDGNRNKNMEGLKKLLKKDIKLDIFSDDNWDYFIDAAGLVTERNARRKRRERDDTLILNYLERMSAVEVTKSHLKKRGLI